MIYKYFYRYEKELKALYQIISGLLSECKETKCRHGELIGMILKKTGVRPSELIAVLATLMEEMAYAENWVADKYMIHEYKRAPKYIYIEHQSYLRENSAGLVDLRESRDAAHSKLVVANGNVMWDNIVIDKELSGPGVTIYESSVIRGILNTPLVALIVKGNIVTRLENITSRYLLCNKTLFMTADNIEAPIALISSAVIDNISINIKPRHIKKSVLKKIIYHFTNRCGCSFFEEVFDTGIDMYPDRYYSMIASEATEFISIAYRELKIGWVEISSKYINKARITVPSSSLINIVWPCRPGQHIVVNEKKIVCSQPFSLTERIPEVPRKRVVDSVVFININYVTGGEVVVERI